MYALHTLPGKEEGSFHTRPGPLLAAVDDFGFEIMGRSGHVAYPHLCHNPIDRFGLLVSGIGRIQEEPRAQYGDGVVAVTVAHAGEVTNIVPETATLTGSVRSLSEAEARLQAIADQSQQGFRTKLEYTRYFPPLVNHEEATSFASKVACGVDRRAAHTGD